MYFFLNCRFFHPPRESLKCILLLKNTTSKLTVLTNIYNMIFPDVKHASHKSRAYFRKKNNRKNLLNMYRLYTGDGITKQCNAF